MDGWSQKPISQGSAPSIVDFWLKKNKKYYCKKSVKKIFYFEVNSGILGVCKKKNKSQN